MKSGDIFVSGYWPRESNPSFRGNCGTTTVTPRRLYRDLIQSPWRNWYSSTAVTTESWIRIPGPISRDKNISRFRQTGWNWDRGVYRLCWAGWCGGQVSVQLNQSTCPKVGLLLFDEKTNVMTDLGLERLYTVLRTTDYIVYKAVENFTTRYDCGMVQASGSHTF